ncbi:MAG: hypothetical protein H6522_01015 [Mycolicibacterium sp.]|nr:hypothetical protein [Mycobacterium sp.]MCB0939036.1 hypothetical protein [Mycobacterium sp.]MCB0947284.1 hypothetical protein [Mycobacterium sp.]MCB9415856.1 hypothetical protein [Mycolicibacterium sp.]
MTCTTYGELQNGTNGARPLARKEAEAHRPELLDGVGLIVGIDRFMSEARPVTNFSGNAVATLLVGSSSPCSTMPIPRDARPRSVDHRFPGMADR